MAWEEAMARRTIHRLSAVGVKSAKPGLHPDGLNLYLNVTDSGSRSWLFRFGMKGHERWMGLGPTHTISLAEAREEATRCRQLLLKGIDPLEARRAERAQNELAQHSGTTFRECAERLMASHEAGWRHPKHRQQWVASLATYVYPVIGSLSIQAIDTAMVLKVLEPIWKDKTETASRVRGRIEMVLDWAKAREIRTGENPARWKGHLDHLLPAKGKVSKVRHYTALPYAEIGGYMAKLRSVEGARARALEFVILTAARVGEVLGMRWGEVEGNIWTVPASRMKGGREHRVPLSEPALATLAAFGRRAGDADLVFPGVTGDGLKRLRQRMGYAVTVHGFRSSFRDWASERTSFQGEVAEAALAHAVGDKVEAAYRRGDLFEKRRRLMDAWGQFCATVKDTGKVVPIGMK
jgi:integrase